MCVGRIVPVQAVIIFLVCFPKAMRLYFTSCAVSQHLPHHWHRVITSLLNLITINVKLYLCWSWSQSLSSYIFVELDNNLCQVISLLNLITIYVKLYLCWHLITISYLCWTGQQSMSCYHIFIEIDNNIPLLNLITINVKLSYLCWTW